jgi:hypothetical protein
MRDKDVDWHFGQTMGIPLGERIAIGDTRKAKSGKKKLESDARRSSMKSAPKMARRERSSFQLQLGDSGRFQDRCPEAEWTSFETAPERQEWGHLGVDFESFWAKNGTKTAKKRPKKGSSSYLSVNYVFLYLVNF